jgi:hypothetical protein
MSPLFTRITLLLLLFITTGCPYESDVPLDQPSVSIPEGLPGNWTNQEDSGSVIEVTPKDAFSFEINYTSVKEAPKQYVGHLSQIKNVPILNLHPVTPVSGLSKGYAFFRFRLSANGKELVLTPVTENIKEQFQSSRKLNAFFRKCIHFSFFYDNDEELIYKKLDTIPLQ